MSIEKHTVSQDNTGPLNTQLDYLSLSLSTTVHAFLLSHVLLIPTPFTLFNPVPLCTPWTESPLGLFMLQLYVTNAEASAWAAKTLWRDTSSTSCFCYRKCSQTAFHEETFLNSISNEIKISSSVIYSKHIFCWIMVYLTVDQAWSSELPSESTIQHHCHHKVRFLSFFSCHQKNPINSSEKPESLIDLCVWEQWGLTKQKKGEELSQGQHLQKSLPARCPFCSISYPLPSLSNPSPHSFNSDE